MPEAGQSARRPARAGRGRAGAPARKRMRAALGLALWLAPGSGFSATIASGEFLPAEALTERWVAASFAGSPSEGSALAGASSPPIPAARIQFGRERERKRGVRGAGNASALLTALMSAVVPGAGQLRNGSTLRGLGFLALEVTGWVAYGAFQQGAREKRVEYDALASRYWEYERYHTRAPDPDSCTVHGCPSGVWSEESDAEILATLESGQRSRFHEYIRRDAYACGWDTPDSREIYRGLWDDREAVLSAKRWTGRAIFLNHLLAAADAFIEARSARKGEGERTDVQLRMRGFPADPHPEVRLTRRF